MTKARAHSWEVIDEFWSRVEPLVPQPVRDPGRPYKRAAGAGRPAKPARASPPGWYSRPSCMCCAQAASGRPCQPNALAAPGAIHQKFMLWSRAGFFENLWRAGLAEYDDLEGIAWRWQSIDGALFKAPLAQQAVGRNPTDRGKKGSKRHLLADGRGVPLSLVVTGANAHDVTQMEAVLSGCMPKRPAPRQRRSEHLCADAGYRGRNTMRIILAHGYIPHVVSRKSEALSKKRDPGEKVRRWVVEACHVWFNRFRKLLVRYGKLEHAFLVLNHLAAAIIALRKIQLPVNIIRG